MHIQDLTCLGNQDWVDFSGSVRMPSLFDLSLRVHDLIDSYLFHNDLHHYTSAIEPQFTVSPTRIQFQEILPQAEMSDECCRVFRDDLPCYSYTNLKGRGDSAHPSHLCPRSLS